LLNFLSCYISGKRICDDKYKNDLKQQPCSSTSLTNLTDADSDSFASSVDSDDYANADKYGDMIWRLLEKQEDDNDGKQ